MAQPQSSPRITVTWLFAGALLATLVYIVRLQRALAAAQQRGDTYRDIAAALDRQHDA